MVTLLIYNIDIKLVSLDSYYVEIIMFTILYHISRKKILYHINGIFMEKLLWPKLFPTQTQCHVKKRGNMLVMTGKTYSIRNSPRLQEVTLFFR